MDRSFDLVLLTRFLAICAGAVTAYVLRSELQIGYAALSIVAASALLNFGVYGLSPQRFSRLRRRISPFVGVGCWAALMSVTGGIGSPFIAGLSMEIVLAAIAVSPRGIVAIATGATGALVAQQALVGYSGVGFALVLHGTFLLAIGLATAWITSRWSRTRDQFVSESEVLGTRLDSLERELADERTLSQMGERVARLAHGLKNAIHSLRGFASLIEPKIPGESGAGQEALDGLRAAIDDLEALARLTLDADAETFAGAFGGSSEASPAVLGAASEPLDTGASASARRPGDSAQPAGSTGSRRATSDAAGSPAGSSSLLEQALDRALSEMKVSQPGVTWTVSGDVSALRVVMSADSIAEALLILMRNATDAMGGQGAGALEVVSDDDRVRLAVRDEGCGISPEEMERIFTPGYTTKSGGSGYGLFLARRLVEEHGGELRLATPPEGGVIAELTLLRAERPGAGDPATRLANA